MTLDSWAKQGGHTDAWIATQIGRERSYITRLRNRKVAASLETALALSRLTKGRVPVEEFLPPQTEAAE